VCSKIVLVCSKIVLVCSKTVQVCNKIVLKQRYNIWNDKIMLNNLTWKIDGCKWCTQSHFQYIVSLCLSTVKVTICVYKPKVILPSLSTSTCENNSSMSTSVMLNALTRMFFRSSLLMNPCWLESKSYKSTWTYCKLYKNKN